MTWEGPRTASFLFQDPSKIPSWLKINKIYYPDFIVPDPKVPAKGPGLLLPAGVACRFFSTTESHLSLTDSPPRMGIWTVQPRDAPVHTEELSFVGAG